MALVSRWHKRASAEFEETLQYVNGEFGTRVAERLYDEVSARIVQLCQFPDLGLPYKDLFYQGYQVRILHMRRSSIIYCHDSLTLFILSFWNNRRNPEDLLTLLS